VRLLGWPLLLDENLHPEVVEELRRRGDRVETVVEAGLAQATDPEILAHATSSGRLVVTHDADFGTLAVQQGQPFTGIIFLRPGHIRPGFVIEMLDALDQSTLDPTPPFIIVAERRAGAIRFRFRTRFPIPGQPTPGS
jgi:predicted nuclease of predicted toxin-antitoxin system